MQPFVPPKRKFTYLLLAQCILLLAYPYLAGGGNIAVSIGILSMLVLVSGAYAVSLNRKVFVISLLLGVPTLIGSLGMTLGRSFLPESLTIPCTAAFYAFTACVVLYYVLKSERVTADTLSGAMSVYVQMGLTWTMLYFFVEHVSPGSFTNVRGSELVQRAELIYFSFSTLTTLGFGDILPVSAPARSLAVVEAIFGVLYLTVLIARLVGLHLAHSNTFKSSR